MHSAVARFMAAGSLGAITTRSSGVTPASMIETEAACAIAPG